MLGETSMLLQFSVVNFLSIKDEVVLNMAPAKSRTMRNHEITDARNKKTTALPLASIYGANASGKSNLVIGMVFAKNLIIKGTRGDQKTGATPHRLDPKSEKQPCRFEFVFKHDGVLYTYGFVVSPEAVLEEWLFAYFSNQEAKIFERTTQDGTTKVEPGPKLIKDAGGTRFIEFIAKSTRPNQLFLAEAVEKNIEFVKPVAHWFSDHLKIIEADAHFFALASQASADGGLLEYLSHFLRIADTGVKGIRSVREEVDLEKYLGISSAQTEEIREKLLSQTNEGHAGVFEVTKAGRTLSLRREEDGTIVRHELKTEHQQTEGGEVKFDISSESDGTRRLMHLAPILYDMSQHDVVFVVDELDRSLHTALAKLFIESVLAGVFEKGLRSQLILTTHDTNLLDRKLLRRDEIWFMEKDNEGASHLSSLAEFKVSDGLNYENGYLNGRFGAIPFVGNYRELLG